MESLNFFTPLVYKYQTSTKIQEFFHAVEENIDAYFYLGGKRVLLVMKNENGTYIAKSKEGKYYANWETGRRADFKSCLIDAIKVASWFTLVIPAFLMAGKLLFRYMHHYYPLEITAEYGTQAFRQKYLFEILKSQLGSFSWNGFNPQQEIISMLTDKKLTRNAWVFPDIEGHNKNGTTEWVREISEQFFKNSVRFAHLVLNKEEVYSQSSDNHKKASSYEIASKMFQKFAVKLVGKITCWTHPSYFSEAHKKLHVLAYKLFTEKLPVNIVFCEAQGLEFDVREENEVTHVEGKNYMYFGDALVTENAHHFIDSNQEKVHGSLPIGYIGICQRLTVPSKELMNYEKGKGLPSLKIDVAVTPLFRTLKEAKQVFIVV